MPQPAAIPRPRILARPPKRWPSTAGTPLDRLLDRLPVGILALRPDSGTIVYANERAEHMPGRSLFDVDAPVTFADLTARRADGAKLSPEHFPLARIVAGSPKVREDLSFVRPDGVLVRTRVTAAPITGAGDALGVVALVLDDLADEERVAEDPAAEQHAEDHEPESQRDLFLGMLGHDLRAPLAGIITSASYLLRHLQLSPENARILGRVVSLGERCVRMADQILEFARARLGARIPLTPQHAELRAVVQSVVAGFDPTPENRRVVMDLRGRGEGYWDPDRLAQVVMNLIDNALRHGDPRGTVRVSLLDAADATRLQVHNDGPPIPGPLLATLFDPFERAQGHLSGSRVVRKPSSSSAAGSSGIGLGLSIAYAIVRAHGGTLAVASTEAKGTTFTVSLPTTARGESSVLPAARSAEPSARSWGEAGT